MPLDSNVRVQIINYAESFLGTPHDQIDCSHFLWIVFKQFFPKFPYLQSDQYPTSVLFTSVQGEMQSADVLVWNGHVALVVNPVAGSFIGSQTSRGVAITSLSNPYWAQRKPIAYLTLV
jgi:cell wall-associated NlpC family hydrolase